MPPGWIIFGPSHAAAALVMPPPCLPCLPSAEALQEHDPSLPVLGLNWAFVFVGVCVVSEAQVPSASFPSPARVSQQFGGLTLELVSPWLSRLT